MKTLILTGPKNGGAYSGGKREVKEEAWAGQTGNKEKSGEIKLDPAWPAWEVRGSKLKKFLYSYS